MKIQFSTLGATCIFCFSLVAAAQTGADKAPPTSPNSAQATPVVKEPLAFGLEDGTPVKLRLNRAMSSADAQVKDTVDFEVTEEVKVHDVVVIPRGGMAWGTVTLAQPKRRMGRGGKLDITIDNVRLTSAEKVPLRAVRDVKGGGHQGAIASAVVVSGVLFFPVAPLFLLKTGKDITIPKGTEITAYINGDIPLDPAKFAPHNDIKPEAVPALAQPSTPPPESPPAPQAAPTP